MADPTLHQVFGSNAQQDLNYLTIDKQDLAARGLNPTNFNTAESLLVALVLMASEQLTEANRSVDLDNRNVSVVYAGQDLISQGGRVFRRDAFSVLLYVPTSYAPVLPSEFDVSN